MGFYYSVYGLLLCADVPLPGLTSLPFTSKADIEVWLQSKPLINEDTQEVQPWYISSYNDEKGEPVLKVWRLMEGAFFKLRYSDGAEFFVNRTGNQIWATWSDSLALEDATVYLLGPIIGFVLRLRGIVCLHASAISIGDYAIALLGPAGSGKSTTAARLAKLGFPILSDDVVALSDQNKIFLAQPAYPHLRLWPSAVNMLYGAPDALPRLVPGQSPWDKRYLNLAEGDYKFQEDPLPIAAIYLLSHRSEYSIAPSIEELTAGAGLIALVSNAYSSYLLDKTMRAQEFELLSRVVSSVFMRRIIPHANPTYLPKLCDMILEDSRFLSRSSPMISERNNITLSK